MAGPLLTKHDSTTTIKLLCSYGGKILPRYTDGKLRYHGGQTRVLAVDRSISFSELLVKLGELCGNGSGSKSAVRLRCQLPTEDLDALVSITCDEDLVNLIEEYDRESIQLSKPLKIRAFLSIPKKLSPSPSSSTATATASGSGSGSSSSASTTTHEAGSPKSPLSSAERSPVTASSNRSNRCINHLTKPPLHFPARYNKFAGMIPHYAYGGYGNPSRTYLVHNGNHWQ